MLPDPLELNKPVFTAVTSQAKVPTRVIDLEEGRTVRNFDYGANQKGQLVISHNDSNENKGVVTKRSTIKLSLTSLAYANEDQSVPYPSPLTASVSISFALPSALGFSGYDVVTLFNLLSSLLMTDGGNSITYERLLRILAGEP